MQFVQLFFEIKCVTIFFLVNIIVHECRYFYVFVVFEICFISISWKFTILDNLHFVSLLLIYHMAYKMLLTDKRREFFRWIFQIFFKFKTGSVTLICDEISSVNVMMAGVVITTGRFNIDKATHSEWLKNVQRNTFYSFFFNYCWFTTWVKKLLIFYLFLSSEKFN